MNCHLISFFVIQKKAQCCFCKKCLLYSGRQLDSSYWKASLKMPAKHHCWSSLVVCTLIIRSKNSVSRLLYEFLRNYILSFQDLHMQQSGNPVKIMNFQVLMMLLLFPSRSIILMLYLSLTFRGDQTNFCESEFSCTNGISTNLEGGCVLPLWNEFPSIFSAL